MAESARLFLKIEEDFRDDTDGKMKDELVGKLRNQLVKVKATLDKGVLGNEYDRLDKQRRALQSAVYVAERSWAFNTTNAKS